MHMLAFENALGRSSPLPLSLATVLLFCGAHQRLWIGAMYRSPATVLFDHVSTVTNKVGCWARAYSSPACSDSKRRKLGQQTLAASAVHNSERVHAMANGHAWQRPSRHSRQKSNTCRFAATTASKLVHNRQRPRFGGLVQGNCGAAYAGEHRPCSFNSLAG